MEIWIAVDGRRFGPYAENQVGNMLTAGQIPPVAQLWIPAFNQWVVASTLPAYRGPQTVAPVPAAAVSAQPPTQTPSPAGAAPTSQPGYAAPVAALLGATAPPVTQSPQQPSAGPPAYAGGRTVATPAGFSDGNGWAIAALVLGIMAAAISWLPILNNLSVILAIIGLILLVPAFLKVRNGGGGKGKSIAGSILCVVAIVITLLTQMLFVSAVNGVSDAVDQVQQQMTAQDNAIKIAMGAVSNDVLGAKGSAKVTNTGEDPVSGGTFKVQALTRTGSVVDESLASFPALKAGQTGTADVLFLKKLPAGATFEVSQVDAYSS